MACDLCDNRQFGVPGQGPHNADIVIIGEAPGENENKTGNPFVGRAGKILNDMLVEAGISRGDCYVTNMVKCWPGPGNPDPTPDQIEACRPWLDQQLELIQPRGILTFGKYSTGKFIDVTGTNMGRIQGSIRQAWWEPDKPVYIMPIYHPAYLGRNPAERPTSQEHLNKFKEIVYGF